MLPMCIKYYFNKILHGELMKKFLFALCIVQAIYAMEFVAHAAPRHEDSHLVRLVKAIGKAIGADASIEDVSIEETDGKIFLEGTPEAVQQKLDSLNDLGELRKHCLPFDTRATVVNTVPALDSWDSFFKAIGVNLAEVNIIDVTQATDDGSSLTFSGNDGLNKMAGMLYVSALKKKSSLFSLAVSAASTIKIDLVEERNDSLTIHYGRLGAFLASLPAEDVAKAEAEGKSDGSSTRRVAIDASSMLRKFIAACSDTVVLQPVEGSPGTYTPSTISLAEGNQALVPGCVDIVADNSGSMASFLDAKNTRIGTVNDQLPGLLQAIAKALPAGAELKVNIYTVNDALKLFQELTLTNGMKTPRLNTINASGGTSLHTMTDLFTTPNHVVIAYTDGEDYSSSLEIQESFQKISAARNTGNIAQVTLIGVCGVRSKYFTTTADQTGGKSYTADMSTFIQDLCQSASSLTQARDPLTLVLQGKQVTLWQSGALGLHAAKQTVRAGDTVNFGGNVRTVPDYVREIEKHLAEAKRIKELTGSSKY